MQNQTDSVRSAKPQEPRFARRVAASFNKSVQATAGSLAVWMFGGVLMLWSSRAVPDLYR